MLYVMDNALKDLESANKTGILGGGQIVGCKYKSRLYNWDCVDRRLGCPKPLLRANEPTKQCIDLLPILLIGLVKVT